MIIQEFPKQNVSSLEMAIMQDIKRIVDSLVEKYGLTMTTDISVRMDMPQYASEPVYDFSFSFNEIPELFDHKYVPGDFDYDPEHPNDCETIQSKYYELVEFIFSIKGMFAELKPYEFANDGISLTGTLGLSRHLLISKDAH